MLGRNIRIVNSEHSERYKNICRFSFFFPTGRFAHIPSQTNPKSATNNFWYSEGTFRASVSVFIL